MRFLLNNSIAMLTRRLMRARLTTQVVRNLSLQSSRGCRRWISHKPTQTQARNFHEANLISASTSLAQLKQLHNTASRFFKQPNANKNSVKVWAVLTLASGATISLVAIASQVWKREEAKKFYIEPTVRIIAGNNVTEVPLSIAINKFLAHPSHKVLLIRGVSGVGKSRAMVEIKKKLGRHI